MTDIVYFLTEQTFYGHRELLYSLRSLEKHVFGWERVVIVGAKPAWPLNWLNVEIFPDIDPYTHNKDANIIRKMHFVCRLPNISDPFFFVNDDHYFSQDCEAAAWPYYYHGELPGHRGSDYGRRLANTRNLLADRGLPVWHFDVHAPLLIHKQRFLKAFAGLDWIDMDGPGVVLKSVYANSCPEIVAARQPLTDLKITRKTAAGTVDDWLARLAGRPCWSTGEFVAPVLWEVVERLYPEKSRFER